MEWPLFLARSGTSGVVSKGLGMHNAMSPGFGDLPLHVHGLSLYRVVLLSQIQLVEEGMASQEEEGRAAIR